MWSFSWNWLIEILAQEIINQEQVYFLVPKWVKANTSPSGQNRIIRGRKGE